MKVKELIRMLSELPEDEDVFIPISNRGAWTNNFMTPVIQVEPITISCDDPTRLGSVIVGKVRKS